VNQTAGSGEELLRSALNKAELETLEALKLQYFQNATKFLAKGDYESALAEIKRVLLIDPEHRLARDYEARVAELQASRAQAQKPEPVPQKDLSRVVPAAAETAIKADAPAPRRKPRKTLLYAALFAFLLLGTTGVLTLEKANDDTQPPVASVAAAPRQVSISAPAERLAESTVAEESTLPMETPAIVEPVHTPAVVGKSAPKQEPVRPEPTPAPVTGPSRSENLASATGSAALAVHAAGKTEPPAAPETKDVIALAPPEAKPLASASTAAAEPVRESAPFVAVQQDPRIVRLEKPRLPDIVVQKHLSGSVTAKVLIDRDGKPQDVTILTSTDGVFEPPVIDAIARSTFSPGMMGSGPVAAWLVIPFKFK